MRLAWLRRFLAAEDGSIAVMGALALVSTLGMSGLAVEVGNGYAAKVRNQRVADMAALGAATAYKNGSQSIAAARQVASDIVVASGLAASSAMVTQVTVGSADAIKVSVTTSVPIKLAAIIAASPSFSVTNMAIASLSGGGGGLGCINALSNTGNTVSADGGAQVLASGCAISTNGTIYSSNTSATVTAKQMTASAINDPATSWGGAGVITNPTARNWTLKANGASDTIKTGNVAVQNALCAVNKLAGTSDADYSGGNTACTTPLVAPTVYTTASTTDWTTDYAIKAATGFSSYRTADYQCVYNVPAGTYNIRKLTVTGGCTVSFVSGSTLTFGAIDMSGENMTIGDGQLIVTGNFNVNGNNPLTIGNGYHSFGSLTINGGKKLDLGSGNFNLSGGIAVSGGSYLKVKIAAGNTVTIGHDGSGNAISESGGSQVCFTADCSAPTAAAGTFSADGNVANDGGGSNLVLPKAATHVVNGNVALASAAAFGAGLYVIKGDWTNGTGCGGCVMSGTDVTFALGGTFNFAGGTSFDLAAPTASSTYGIADVLLVTKSASGTSISAGSSGKASGLIYAPKSAFTSSGGSSISSNGSACMMLVVSTVAVSGSGTINTSNCTSLATSSGGGSGPVALLQ